MRRTALFILLLLLLTACATPGERNAIEQRDAVPLELGIRQGDTLSCADRNCAKFYRLAVSEPRTITIEVASPTDPVAADYGVALFTHDFELVAEDRRGYRRPRSITEDLAAGVYYVRVRNLFDLAEPLQYEVRAIAGHPAAIAESPTPRSVKAPVETNNAPPPRPTKVKPPPPPRRRPPLRTTAIPTPAPPLEPQRRREEEAPPRTVLLRSEVIEVERASGAPVAVLIEAGAATGVSRGSSGQLVDGRTAIGLVEIVDVYPGGSRARIVGELRGDITDATVVEVFHLGD